MILGFKQNFPWKEDKQPVPTNFKEKIKAAAPDVWVHPKSGLRVNNVSLWRPKIHTIQMIYRGPKYSIKDHFNKGIPELEKCVSVQKIEIAFGITVGPYTSVIIAIDGRILSETEREQLAVNDGFNSLQDFYKWFTKPFTGKIIHWRDYRY
jgi:hypothetical protein